MTTGEERSNKVPAKFRVRFFEKKVSLEIIDNIFYKGRKNHFYLGTIGIWHYWLLKD
jgi:hypothetical protein